ncbi:MAG: uncharacterized protein A8A55_2053 [Amphiamblys sp. WSBS2006]|nr:MAG: uncharacterized protein A8A55_2053 [Amphiamblys sp. WSBS2006]
MRSRKCSSVDSNRKGHLQSKGEENPRKPDCVYFPPTEKGKRVPSPVSLLRFVYDETEAKTFYLEASDIIEEVARFVSEHVAGVIETDTVRVEPYSKHQTEFLLAEQNPFLSLSNTQSVVQALPEGIAEVSIVRQKKTTSAIVTKKKHRNFVDWFLIIEECRCEDRWPATRNFPTRRKEAALPRPFSQKEFLFDPETTQGTP